MLVIIKLLRLLIGLIIIFNLPSRVIAQTCVSGNCEYGKGTLIYDNEDKYVGQVSRDSPSGQGTLTLKHGGKIVGDFLFGKILIDGTYYYPNGDIYVGDIFELKKSGVGTLTYANGTVKKGAWNEGKYFGTEAQWKAYKEKEKISKAVIEEKEKIANRAKIRKQIESDRPSREATLKREKISKVKYDRIYNACLLDKGDNVTNIVIIRALTKTCAAIADDPSWWDEIKYN